MEQEIFKSIDEFHKEYPSLKEGKTSSGAYGSVYTVSGKDFVVKVGSIDNLINDINILSQIEHPNIIPIISFSLDMKSKQALIAMPKGIPLREYIMKIHRIKGQREIKRIMYGLMCGLQAIEGMGIVHTDIKPDNIVMVHDQPMYIDFGIALYTIPILCNQNRYSTVKESITACKHMYNPRGYRYTVTFREPEFLPDIMDSYKGDVYALGKTYEYLYTRKFEPSSLPVMTSSEPFNNIINLMLSERKYRLDASELLKHPYFNDVRQECTSGIREIPAVPSKSSIFRKDLEIQARYYSAVVKIIQACINAEFDIRMLFLVLHNTHRSISVMKTRTKDEILLLLSVNASLANACLNRAPVIPDKYGSYGESLFNKMLTDVLGVLGGIVTTPTYWDENISGEDIIPLLEATISWNYTASAVPIYSHGQITKNVDTGILSLWMVGINDGTSLFKRIHDGVNNYQDKVRIRKDFIPSSYLLLTDNDLPLKPNVDLYYQEIMDKPFDVRNNLGFVYALRSRMEVDTDLSNHILHSLMNPDLKDLPYVEMYDVIFGKEKLSLKGENIESLAINTYTSSYSDIKYALSRE